MEINTEYIEVKKTARYTTFGNLSEKTKYFWFCLHGSNMRCEQMIYKFKDFDPNEHYVVSPEGLSRFYEKDFSGEVVAAWMTSRDRLKEIDDFSYYLTKLYQQISLQLPEHCKKIIFGFSQGGTTAYRWLHQEEIVCDTILGYSCWIPEDIDLKTSKTNFQNIQQLYTYGLQDQYVTPDRVEALKEVISKNELEVIIKESEGDHRINRENLIKIFENNIA